MKDLGGKCKLGFFLLKERGEERKKSLLDAPVLTQ